MIRLTYLLGVVRIGCEASAVLVGRLVNAGFIERC